MARAGEVSVSILWGVSNSSNAERLCTTTGSSIRVVGPKRLKAADMVTFPYPGYPTDLQATYMSLCCVAEGTSHVRETVFEDRFTHVMELTRLGASIKVAGDEATIKGVPELSGASVMESCLRIAACPDPTRASG